MDERETEGRIPLRVDFSLPSNDETLRQFGGAASYWHSRWVRLSVNYAAYMTPGSGSSDNLAVVPGNVTKGGNPNAHTLHELGTRLQLWF